MSIDRSESMAVDRNPAGAIGARHPLERVLDLIARNERDVPGSEHTNYPPDVSQRSAVSALATSPPMRPDPSWGLHPRAQAAPSPIERLVSILRYKWTFMLVFALMSAPLIALIWTQIVPQYTARAEVRVRPIIRPLVFQTPDNGPIPFYSSFVNTQVSLMRSLTVLQRALDQREVQRTRWYKAVPETFMQKLGGAAAPPVERLRASLLVSPRPGTEIIDVSFADASPDEAVLIVDTILSQYMKYIGEKSDAMNDEVYRELTERYTSLANEIEGRERVRAELRKSLGTQTPQELIASKRVRLDAAEARLSTLRNTISILEWEIAQAEDGDSNGVTGVASARQPDYSADAEWRALNVNVSTAQHQLDISRYTPNHPERLRLERDLEFARDLLKQREMQLDEQWRNQPISVAGVPVVATTDGSLTYEVTAVPLDHQLARAKQEEQLVLAEYNKEKKEFDALFESAQLFDKETSTLTHKTGLFDAVRQRLDQKNMERNVPGSIEILMQAFAPSKPDQDRRVVFTAMVLFLGVGVGGGVAYLRASRNQTVCAFRDMPQPTQGPFLGHVPLIRTTQPLERLLYEGGEQRQTHLVESIRVLRTALLSRLDDRSGATVLVTSADEGTGKSSFTVMLGRSIAQAGRKVLIIDADFHKMTLSGVFNLRDEAGLMEALSYKVIDGLPIFSAKTPGLDVMPAGRRDSNGAAFEGIADGAFKTCVARLREQYGYEIILLDSSPILPVADAAILAGQVDGTVMVEREHVSRRTRILDALGRLRSSGGRLLGTVFVGSLNREGYGYGQAEEYGPDDENDRRPVASVAATVDDTGPCDVPDLAKNVETLRSLALGSLARMYYPEQRMFAFRLRRSQQGEIPEGVSRRYTATALIGLAGEDPQTVAQVLGKHSPDEVCKRLLKDVDEMEDLGQVALTTWAARTLDHRNSSAAVKALRRMEPGQRLYPTVELSWALTALVLDGNDPADMALAQTIAEVLIASFKEESGLFPSGRTEGHLSALRAHVCCFADVVYPIQALSYYHMATGDARAAEVAVRCAERMCELQGPEGQWWWHFDIRTGRVVERYPVYAVHQDAMAPMALFALADACGQDHSEAIEKGLRWLFDPPEKAGSLIDTEREVIWRKVTRRGAGKFVRGLQAMASSMHPGIRVPGVDVLFPPAAIDYESRPYHMGWILYAWPAGRHS